MNINIISLSGKKNIHINIMNKAQHNVFNIPLILARFSLRALNASSVFFFFE